MITPDEIREATAAALKTKTKAKIYKNEVVEGFLAPCFFISSYITSVRAAGKSILKAEAAVEISYFASKDAEKRVRNENDAYKVMSALSELFSAKLHVKDRFLNITDNSFSWVGENNDIPAFQFALEYFDDRDEENDSTGSELITEINITERIEK